MTVGNKNMNALTFIILIFSVLGGIDYVFGCKFGIGKEFERGFMMLGTLALAMIGMIVVAPLIASLLNPFFDFVYTSFRIDPSIIPASLFANDMGGAPLATEVAKNKEIGLFNALVVSSMMGCTISFTIPFAISAVKKEQHREVLLGILCGIVTIPVGCFVSGIICKIPIGALVVNLLPIIILSAIIALGLIKFPNACVKIFSAFAFVIKIILVMGIVFGVINFLCKKPVIPRLETIENAGLNCLNVAIVMPGTFPLIYVLSKVLKKPIEAFGTKLGVNSDSALGFLASLATSVTTFGMMDKMDKKGAMLNSAFAVSAAFMFAAHLAYTMAFDSSMLIPVMVGKTVSGVSAFLLAFFLSRKFE